MGRDNLSDSACVTTQTDGNSIVMNEESRGTTRGDAMMGGRLLALADGDGYTELTEAVSLLVSGPGAGPPLFGGALRWVVTAIADVVVDKMGPEVEDGEPLTLTLRTGTGENLDLDELPEPESHLMKAVAAVVAGDTDRAFADLDPVMSMDHTAQMEALLEAVLWLDRILDTPSANAPDTLPW